MCGGGLSLLNLLYYFCFMFWDFFGPQGMWDLAPRPGIEPTPTALEGKVLATGLPEKSHSEVFLRGAPTCILALALYLMDLL